MNVARPSVFNLIEIFRSSRKATNHVLVAKAHCEQKYHHDFYCEVERPLINK